MAALLLVSPQVMARVIDNANETIGSGNSADRYHLQNGATLTATDAHTFDIQVRSGSTLYLDRGHVTGSGFDDGVGVSGSTAKITASLINAGTNASGLSVGDGVGGTVSKVSVLDSTITGGRNGGLVNGRSQLDLERSSLTGTNPDGYGLLMSSGNATASDKSSITGGKNGVLILFNTGISAPSTLVLDDQSSVIGQNGSAILVDGFNISTPSANIEVRNNSTLEGSNGTLLEVKGGGSANLLVNNSVLTGNVMVEAGSAGTVQLENSATLTGRLDNVEHLTVNSDATWVMVGDGDIARLSMDGGAIKLGDPSEFYTLSMGTLSGNGTFIMDADFSTGNVDFLDVTGTATGNHRLLIGSSGADPTATSSLHVVHAGSGDASFSLLGGAVDLGAFSYDLIQRDSNNWYLDTTTRVVSPGTRSVLALFNTAPTVWYGELSTLRSRMGEVRMNEGKAGGWMRAYGNRFDVSASAGVSYRQTQQGLSFGADAPLPVGDGQWLVGLLGGYSKSDLDLGRGTDGTVNSYYVGAYTTWLDRQSGYYVDGVLKFNRFQNKSDVQLSDGKKTKGSYDNNGVGASLEFGRHITLDDGYFVEPYTQLSGVIVQGQDYDLDNGLSAEGDRTRSLLGKIGATVGRNFDLGAGTVVQPYIRAAYAHEFAKNNQVKVNRNTFNNDLSGSRGELGAGVAMTVTDKVSIHVDLDYSNGDKLEQPWGANVGVRYSW
ncbi:outer membrane autotransporter protein [Pseudomonas lini]|uniref:autotransporter outer membrane beta-barrel domain-containing protein n=1 Tax=Pseudomonas lini TaxID=163011 RepID=UPI002783D9AF|nr:autotransporter outer membrane beta-barrel domain-containing protein [Pseudomonas lini]MDQ0127232.1 outer membrane autotransporter protein [Pseudomonas lini]